MFFAFTASKTKVIIKIIIWLDYIPCVDDLTATFRAWKFDVLVHDSITL